MNGKGKAEYLATGQGDGADERLDSVRRALGDPNTWETPPQSVADGVIAEIRAASSPFEATPRRPTWRRFGYAVAGVTVVILLLAFFGTLDRGTRVALEGTELLPEASGTAFLQDTDAGWSIRLEVEGLPPAEPGFYYEGWVWSDEGDGVSIGTFHLRNGTRPLNLWAGVDVEEYPAIWVSLEPEDGSPEVSESIVLWGKLEE